MIKYDGMHVRLSDCDFLRQLEFVPKFGRRRPIKLYRIEDDVVILPRAFAINRYPNFVYEGRRGETIDVDFCGSLRDYQKVAVDALDAAAIFSGGTLALHTGAGKTVIACALIAKLKLKTLVLVHKKCLRTQWLSKLSAFLPTAHVTLLQRPRLCTEGDVVVAMLPSVAMSYDAKLFDSFGLVIVDESHAINTRVFSQALPKIMTRFVVGLSATPQRKDGLHQIFEASIGPLLYDHPFQQNRLPVQVRLVYAPNTISRRNALVVSIISSDVDDGGKVLVLCERRLHVFEITGLLRDARVDATSYVGGDKELRHASVIVATFSMAATGLDVPYLTTLVLAAPRCDVVQACGRILRQESCKAKQIFDIVDRHDQVCTNAMRIRVQSYHRQKFCVSRYGI